jgi:hypothetical protein
MNVIYGEVRLTYPPANCRQFYRILKRTPAALPASASGHDQKYRRGIEDESAKNGRRICFAR